MSLPSSFSRIRLLALGITLGILVNFVPFSSLASFVQGEEQKPFDPNYFLSKDIDLETMILTYHQQMNVTFNTSIARMIALLKDQKDTLDPEVAVFLKPPETGKEDACFMTDDSMNVSVYCMALRGDLLYDAFTRGMDYQRSLALKPTANDTQDSLQSRLSYRKARIDRELVDAKGAFDATLTAYSELATAFPLHMQLEVVKDSLIRYRDRLVEIRKKVETFPAKFVDATSTNCE